MARPRKRPVAAGQAETAPLLALEPDLGKFWPVQGRLRAAKEHKKRKELNLFGDVYDLFDALSSTR